MLGKLARDLRAIGYFAHYFQSIDDDKLVRFAKENGHALLTRDTRIRQRKDLGVHLFIRSDFAFEQLAQVVRELSLCVDASRFYTVCIECNLALVTLQKSEVRGLVPPYVYKTQDRFSCCPGCEKIFWPATHMDHMDQRLRKTLSPFLKRGSK